MKKVDVAFLGGLGNQLFQYAFMVYLDKIKGADCSFNASYHKRFKVHSGFEADKVFDFSPYKESRKNYYTLPYRLFRKAKSVLRFGGSRILCDDEGFREDKLVGAYEGYWQDVRFYRAVEDVLKERFLGIDGYCADRALLDEIRTSNSVFLHVRRGDYCNDPLYVNLCATDYYRQAIDYVKNTVPDARFFVFSDDIAWSQSFFKDETDFTFVSYEGQTALGDLALMLAARHAVIANSSFSWWGTAFGSKETVVHPTSYYTTGKTSPLYFERWHAIEPHTL